MTHERALDLSFLLGPPADPDFRALFDEAQHRLATGSTGTEALLEPRLPFLFRRQGDRPSIFDEILSSILGEAVEVDTPFFSFGYLRRLWVAGIQLRPGDVHGPAAAVDRVFGDPEIARAIAASLGLALKLDWVQCSRDLGPVDENAHAEEAP